MVPRLPFDAGPTSRKRSASCAPEPPADDASTTPATWPSSSETTVPPQSAATLCSTPASAPPSRAPTSNASANDCASTTPAPSSSATLAVVSTITGRALRPFWNASVQTLSQSLSLPQKTDLCDSAWSSWNGSVASMAQRSWFSTKLRTPPTKTNYATTYSPSQLSSWRATTAAAQQQTANAAKRQQKRIMTQKRQANTTMKIRLEPTKDQQRLLKQWLGTNRWTYNQAVASQLTKKNQLREMCVNNDAFEHDESRQWVLDTPYEVRDSAICDYTKALKSTKAKLKLGQISEFKMRFRSKKDRQQSFNVRNRDYKQAQGGAAFSMFRGYFTKAGVSAEIKAREPLPASLEYDARLVRTRLGEWYLCMPQYVDDMPHALGGESQAPFAATPVNNTNAAPTETTPTRRVCSLDPGVRTFQTLFDASTGAVIEVGSGDLARFYRLCKAADQLQSRRDQTHGKKRYKLKRAQLRIYEKIRRLVREVHCKLAAFLVENYDVVLLPSFDTSRMIVRNGRKLHSKTARAMLTWSHYRFKQRLLDKAEKTQGRCTVVVCGEEYTSKTCTRCGFLHTKLGGAKVFRCPQCGLVIERDHNGARNVLLKNASHFGLSVVQSSGNVEVQQGGVEATLLAIGLQEVDMLQSDGGHNCVHLIADVHF